MTDTTTKPKTARPAKEAESVHSPVETPKNSVRLFLEIIQGKRSTLYQLIPLNPDPRVAVKAWRLIRPGTEGRKSYDVAIQANGYLSCTCADATYRQHECKHAKAIKTLGLLSKEK